MPNILLKLNYYLRLFFHACIVVYVCLKHEGGITMKYKDMTTEELKTLEASFLKKYEDAKKLMKQFSDPKKMKKHPMFKNLF